MTVQAQLHPLYCIQMTLMLDWIDGWAVTCILSYLQGQVGVLLFLAHLQTWQVGVLQLQVVLLSEVLRHCAFNCLTIFKLQRKPADWKVKRISCSWEPTTAWWVNSEWSVMQKHTSGGWLGVVSHYRLGTSYAWFHSVSLPLSGLGRWWRHWQKISTENMKMKKDAVCHSRCHYYDLIPQI